MKAVAYYPALCALVLVSVPSAARTASDSANLRDWTVARCIAKAADGQPVGADAKRSAAALLERGTAGPAVYERIDRLIVKTLAVRVSGSTGGTYAVLQCLDLARSPALARLVEPRRHR